MTRATDQPLRGIAFAAASTMAYASMDVAVKLMAATYPVATMLVFRNVVVALAMVAFFVLRGRAPVTAHPLAHVWRAVCGTSALFCYFKGLEALPIAQCVAIAFATPLFVTALSRPLLGEQVSAIRWLATAIGFGGVLLIVRPGLDAFHPAMLWPLASALLFALTVISVRRLARDEPATLLLFYAAVFGIVFGCAYAAVDGWVMPAPHHWPALTLIALFGGLGQWLLAQGYRYAPAAVVAPIDYTHMVWVLPLGFVFFREWPDALTLIGTAVLAGGTLWSMWRERRRT